MYIILAILAFSVLIIVHELGHFILAKLNGVKVEEFSIGMGPKIFGIKSGETEYCLKALPIGGYVKMLGEGDEDQVDDPRALSNKSPLQRISIMAAGAFMNILLAIICFAVFISQTGLTLNTVKDVMPNSPAQQAGIKAGDEILAVNNTKVLTNSDLSIGVNEAKGKAVEIKFKSGNDVKQTSITPMKNENGAYLIGILNTHIEKPTVIQSLKGSVNESISMIKQTFHALKTIITGKANLKTDVGGPVTIVRMSGKIAQAGIVPLLWFTAFLSMQLAVFNLLPIPALDGGWIVIVLIELITRRKVPDKVTNFLNTLGFAMLMGLMLLVTLKDIIFPMKF